MYKLTVETLEEGEKNSYEKWATLYEQKFENLNLFDVVMVANGAPYYRTNRDGEKDE